MIKDIIIDTGNDEETMPTERERRLYPEDR